MHWGSHHIFLEYGWSHEKFPRIPKSCNTIQSNFAISKNHPFSLPSSNISTTDVASRWVLCLVQFKNLKVGAVLTCIMISSLAWKLKSFSTIFLNHANSKPQWNNYGEIPVDFHSSPLVLTNHSSLDLVVYVLASSSTHHPIEQAKILVKSYSRLHYPNIFIVEASK